VSAGAFVFPRSGAPRAWMQRLIWLVPAAALLAVAWLSFGALSGRGPLVTITFATAEGLEENKTTIKYRSVNIGVVRGIALRPDRAGVAVTAQLSREVSPLLVDDARFWVVRPRVSMSGVSGIGTLISGAYIGFDTGASGGGRRDFVGLEAPPSTVSARAGRHFSLRADNVGSLDVGAPVYLRRVQVGQVTDVAVARDGRTATVDVFVDAPHHEHVTTASQFWNASGVDVTLGPRGIQLDTQSLASVLAGGIGFETPTGAVDARPADAGATFELQPDRASALRSAGSSAALHRLVFKRPVRGLTAGAAVELAGLELGHVVHVGVDFDAASGAPRTLVDVALDAERIHLRGDAEAVAAPHGGRLRAVLDRLVAAGWRARTRGTDLVTGRRYISFEIAAGAPRARRAQIDWRARPVELPTDDDDASDLPTAAAQLLAKLERLPLDKLASEGTLAMEQMRRTFEATSRLVGRVDDQLVPGAAALFGQAQRTLGAAEQTLSPEAPLQRELRTAASDISGAGQALRALADYLERHPESLIHGKKKDGR
jgi:paraquat-inducible protein B